ncbi:MAG: YidC/Oxa1 family insertase periplasmic-domain containing protein [Bacteroidia bacterium]|nr:YidC/Oxa1 family insertase periplasmic-domain containing protein [Bacteroidia bacterium]
MSRQTWIGLFLITLLMFLWTFWIARTSISQSTSPASVADSLLRPPADTSIASPPHNHSFSPPLDSASRIARFGVYAAHTEGRDSLFSVETPLARWTFSSRGARLLRHQSKNFFTSTGTPVTLWDTTHSQAFLFAEGRTILSSEDLYFSVVHTPPPFFSEGTDSVVFRLTLASDTFIEVTYRIAAHDYRLGWEVNLSPIASRLRNPYILHRISYETPQTEASAELMKPHCALYYRQGDEVESISPDEEDPVTQSLQGRIRWVSAKGQFFCSLFQGEEPFSAATLHSLPFSTLPRYQLQLQVPLQGGRARETWYLGPTRYTLLRSYGELYEKQLNLGWKFIRYINTGFIIPLFAFLEKFLGSYGLIITILAIIVKLLLSPLTWRSYLLGVRMQVVNELPEVKALEEKYKDQPDKLMVERSLLYQQLGISPLSGCIPLLLQIPIFFAMTSFFPNAFELRQESFLWAKDLSSYDTILQWGWKVPLLGDHLSLFALLTALSTLAYTYFTQQSQAAANPALKWLPYFTPVIFFLFLNGYSAALSWYYFVLNLLTIGQTLLMKRFVDKEALIKKLREVQRKKQNKVTIAQQRARMRKWLKK